MHDNEPRVIHHQVEGREELTEEEVRAYLAESGYAGEADQLISDALSSSHFQYTADRHRCVVHRRHRNGDYWRAADTTATEERIKAARPRR